LFRKKDEQFVINRKCKLELYLRQLLERDDILGIEEFVEFLDISKNASCIARNSLNLLGRIDQDKLGYREVIHLPDKKLYFAVSADTQVASRFDSYLNNAKFLWSKKADKDKPTNKAVGAVSCWAKIANTPLLHENYEIMW
jgi:hypothetical protein